MKRVLILGTGSAQLDAVEYLKAAGHEVHGVSYRKEGPCIPLLDKFSQIDICDNIAVSKYVQEHQIDAVYSVGSDLAMPTACAVSEKLGLPRFVSAQTARNCNDKTLLRKCLGDNFRGNLKYKILEKAEDISGWNIWPCIVKPVDNQGQRGVRKVDGPDFFLTLFEEAQSFSKSGKVICEEYVDGPEISVNCFLASGEMLYFRPSDRIVFEDLPGGIIHRHLLPSKVLDEQTVEAVRDIVVETLKKLEINDGPAYFQMKIGKNGPKIIEVTPRLDGCHMWRLIRESETVDLLKATFDCLLGSPVTGLKRTPAKDCELEFFCQAPKTLMDRSTFDVGNVRHLCWYYRDGETIRPINGLMEKAGYCVRSLEEQQRSAN